MTVHFDILIEQARLRRRPGLRFEIGITAGRVTAIEERVDRTGMEALSAETRRV